MNKDKNFIYLKIYLAGKKFDCTKFCNRDNSNCNLLWLVIAAAIERN